MMKIGIYDPYLDTLGGGEKYVISIADHFEKDNDVTIFWDKDLSGEIEEKFSIHLRKTEFARNIFRKNSLITKFFETKKYDLFFFLSDGSIPFLFARKNFLIFQFPPEKKINRLDKIKLSNINKVICYSNYVKKYLDNLLKIDSVVIYPPVEKISGSLPKENIILTVGRFTKDINNKKHEFLIDVFKKMKINNWKLIIAGSYLPSDENLPEELKKRSEGYNIEIIDSPNHKDLSNLYLKAKIYWHATGIGEDIKNYPQKAEHFGISTVEAMGAGAVPVVIGAGGQREIVEDKISGYLWNSESELMKRTKELIQDSSLLNKLSKNARRRSEDFLFSNFSKNLDLLTI